MSHDNGSIHWSLVGVSWQVEHCPGNRSRTVYLGYKTKDNVNWGNVQVRPFIIPLLGWHSFLWVFVLVELYAVMHILLLVSVVCRLGLFVSMQMTTIIVTTPLLLLLATTVQTVEQKVLPPQPCYKEVHITDHSSGHRPAIAKVYIYVCLEW